jgi:hypothetical protein
MIDQAAGAVGNFSTAAASGVVDTINTVNDPVAVDHSVKRALPFDAEEHRRRGKAADALWRELARWGTATARER